MATLPPSEPPRRRWIDGPRLLIGIVVASLAAGPVFFLAGIYLPLVIAGSRVEEAVFFQAGADAPPLPLLLLLAIRYAFLPALLPLTILAAALAVLGAMWMTARAWAVWVATGLLAAGLVALLFPDLWTMRQLLIALAITGMGCTATCRAFARWPDEAGVEDAESSGLDPHRSP